MKKDINLKSGWVKIEKPELDELRKQMRLQYENEGGSKKFNSHLPNYEELRKIIRNKLNEFMEDFDTVIKVHGQENYEIVPGNTFFRDLFFTKRKADSPQFQEYNIEICYLFAYGRTRLDQKVAEKKLSRVGDSTYGPVDTIAKPPVKEESPFRIVISSTVNNMIEAEKIKNHLRDVLGLEVETETRNSHSYRKGSLRQFYESLDSRTYVFPLISRDYLQNENCVKELIEYTQTDLDHYLRHTFHILLKDIYSGSFNIFDSLGRSELLKYWILRIEQLEENHKILIKDKKEEEFYKNLRQDLIEIKGIIEGLHRVVDIIRQGSHNVINDLFITKITGIEELQKILPRRKGSHQINRKLETTYKRIKIPSNNDPTKPEFPPEPFYKPKFPASQTYPIDVPGFTNVWLKDESTNPTGTHKDRLAWEVVIKYKSLIEGLKYRDDETLPQMSIISSGSAAIAIQHLFNLFKIPTKLKVLVDYNLNNSIKDDIRRIGCEIYEYDLSEKLLTSDDIKDLTDNKNGIDITYREVLDPAHDNYYDWLSYEIIKEKPEYCFIPFGTGDLFINVLNIVKIEYFNSFVQKHDPRFFSDVGSMTKCHFMGASSNVPDTRLDKLFSYYLPSLNSFKKYIAELREEYGCVGNKTNFYYVEEKFVDDAFKIADSQSIKYEPSGIAGLALLLQMKGQIDKNSKILIVNTGKTKDIKQLIK